MNCTRCQSPPIEQRDRLGERRLAHAGHVLDQQVALREEADQGEPDGVFLALDHLLDVREQGVEEHAERRVLVSGYRLDHVRGLLLPEIPIVGVREVCPIPARSDPRRTTVRPRAGGRNPAPALHSPVRCCDANAPRTRSSRGCMGERRAGIGAAAFALAHRGGPSGSASHPRGGGVERRSSRCPTGATSATASRPSTERSRTSSRTTSSRISSGAETSRRADGAPDRGPVDSHRLDCARLRWSHSLTSRALTTEVSDAWGEP